MRLAGTNGLRLHGDIVGGEDGDGQWADGAQGGGGEGGAYRRERRLYTARGGRHAV